MGVVMKNNKKIIVLSILCYLLAFKKILSSVTLPIFLEIGILSRSKFSYTYLQIFFEITVSLVLLYLGNKLWENRQNEELKERYVLILTTILLFLTILSFVTGKLPITILFFSYSLWVLLVTKK